MKYFQPRAVAKELGWSTAYLRQICLKLEKNGYVFKKAARDVRRFTRENVNDLKRLQLLVSDEAQTVDSAVEQVSREYKTRANQVADTKVKNSPEASGFLDVAETLTRPVTMLSFDKDAMKLILSELSSEAKDNIILNLLERLRSHPQQ